MLIVLNSIQISLDLHKLLDFLVLYKMYFQTLQPAGCVKSLVPTCSRGLREVSVLFTDANAQIAILSELVWY